MNTPQQQIIWRNPRDLRPHPAVSSLHAWHEDDGDFNSLCDDIRNNGMMPIPVMITKNDLIIDGRHRCRAAAKQQVDVPCVIVDATSDEEVIQIALRTIKHRRHYTAGQIALMAYPVLEHAHKDAVAANLKAARTGNAAANTAVKTSADLAADLGVSRETFDRAARVHQIWNKHHTEKFVFSEDVLEEAGLEPGKEYTLEEVFWPQLMRKDKPMGLGACVAGMEMLVKKNARGGRHGGGIPASTERQLELFNQTWVDLNNRFDYWKGFDATAKKQASEQIQSTFQNMPDDLLKSLKKTISATLKARKNTQR